MKKLYFLYGLAFLICNTLYAQNKNIRFEHLTSDLGLSQNSVKSIVQDVQGYMWFGTLDGLNRFDGHEIKIYRNSPNNPNSVSDNNITALFIDKRGNMWVGTSDKGISIYNPKSDNFTGYRHVKENPLSIASDQINCFYEDSYGNLWIGTSNGICLYDYENDSFSSFARNALVPNGLSDNFITSFAEDKNKTLWVGTNFGIHRYDRKNELFRSYKFEFHDADSAFNPLKINTLYADSHGTVWVGSPSGLSRIENNKISQIFTTHNSAIPGNEITAIFESDPGSLWIGTSFGLTNFNVAKAEFINYAHNQADLSSLSSDEVTSIYRDRSNVLWFGTSLGGVNHINKTSSSIELYRQKPFEQNTLASNKIRSIFVDSKNRIWIGSVDAGISIWNPETKSYTYLKHDPSDENTLPGDHIRCIREDSEGVFWIATDGNGLSAYNEKKKKFTNFSAEEKNPFGLRSDKIWNIYIDKNDNIWLATFGGGVSYLEKRNKDLGVFRTYRSRKTTENSLSNDFVTSVFIQSDGTLWVGTFGGGLNRFIQEGEVFEAYTYNIDDVSSISDDRVYSIFEDSEKNLWIGTKGGLNLYNPDKDNFTRFGVENGFPNNVIMAILEDGHKNLWITTNNGISKFDKKEKIVLRNYGTDDGLQNNEFLVGSYFQQKNGKMYFGGISGYNAFFPDSIKINEVPPKLVINEFKLFNETVVPGPDSPLKQHISQTRKIVLEYYENSFSFDFVALHFSQPSKNKYSYMLENFDKDWIMTNAKRRFATYTNLSPGTYKFMVTGCNSDGVWNEEGIAIEIIILAPWYETWWFRIAAAAALFLAAFSWYKSRVLRIERQKRLLEVQVKERTAEVEKQKQQIELQRDNLEVQNQRIELQNDSIRSSINYAKNIQNAILPTKQTIESVFDSFTIYRPKDIVSGDFIWFNAKYNDEEIPTYYAAAVDCTGHGVPGAFMSLIGSRLLNEIVNEIGVHSPDDILERLDEKIIEALKQQQSENNDGMDVCLCAIQKIDNDNVRVLYAGAKRPLFLFRSNLNELQTVDADRRSIGGTSLKRKKGLKFKLNELTLSHNDRLYLTSDGVIDQNSLDRQRFGTKRFLESVKESVNLDMEFQQKYINDALNNYMDKAEQRDDITVFGIKININKI
ncbi:MAG TPA: hypothetical protein DCQ31_19385 [Bacteroidales bacterium]|nr:hypothetical protein [Bacteroidales bacterium]